MTSLPTGKSVPFIRLPDAPPAEDMNNHLYLNFPGNSHFLSEHFGNKETTIIVGDTCISREPTSSMTGLFEPDLMIAFNVRPELMVERNGYVISEQGKPPDFVLEIGSASTGRRDTTVSERAMLPWASRNIGGLTHREAGSTARPSPVIDWKMVSMFPSRWNSWMGKPGKDTVRH